MSETYPKPNIGAVVIITLLGLAGTICYFLPFRIGFVLFSCVYLLLLVYNVAKRMMRPETWPILASCAAVSAIITGNWLDTILLSVSFYYAISWIVVLLRAYIPDIILLFIIGLVGLILGWLGYRVVLYGCGALCLTALLVSAIRGKLITASYIIIACAMAIAVIPVSATTASGSPLLKVLSYLFFASCLTYPLSALYALTRRLFDNTSLSNN